MVMLLFRFGRQIFKFPAVPEVVFVKLVFKLLFDEEVDIEIKKLPKLVVTQIIWEDENGNELVSFSDGSVGYAKIHVMNEGSFDVTANAEISLTKSGKDLQVNFAGIVDSYGSIDLPANEETIITFNGNYPSVSFLSGGNSDFTGFWTFELSIRDINAKNNGEQFWDSEELVFSNSNNRVEISTPPSLAVTSLSASPTSASEGDVVTLTILLANEGGAAASGNINLLEFGSIVSTANFTIDGFGSQQVQISHTLPNPYDGELTLRVRIDRDSVIPTLGPQDALTDDSEAVKVTVSGTLKESTVSDNSASGTGNTIVIAGAGAVVLIGAGAGYFFYSRSKSSGSDALDAFGSGESPELPPAAPPVTEQPSVAPPEPVAAPPPPTPEPAAAPPTPTPEPAAAPPTPTPEPAAAPPVPAPGETVLNVAVPAGAQPGQQIQIKAPDGRVVTVAIPAGLQPGQQFQVKV